MSAVESIQTKFDVKSSKHPKGCISKQKSGKIQLFGQKEAFYSGNDFAYPHCNFKIHPDNLCFAHLVPFSRVYNGLFSPTQSNLVKLFDQSLVQRISTVAKIGAGSSIVKKHQVVASLA